MGEPDNGRVTSVIPPTTSALRHERGRSSAGAPGRSDGRGLVVIVEAIEGGGTERVVQALADRYPRARIITGVFGRSDAGLFATMQWSTRAELVRLGRRKRHYLAPLYARRLARVPMGNAGLVVSLSSTGWAMAASVPDGARHLTYAAGVPRALYGGVRDYLNDYPGALHPLVRASLPVLRRHHRRLLSRADRIVTVSHVTAGAVAEVGRRRVDVVHPPVRTDFFTPAAQPAAAPQHVLAVARIVAQKRLHLLIEAFRTLDETLVIAGAGPRLERLRRVAPDNVRFVGRVSDAELRELYRGSHALICPTVEEFGLVMAEAQACGVPVIAPRAGGALEIVEDGRTGVLLDRVDDRSIADAVRTVVGTGFSAQACRASAERFSEMRFVAAMERIVDEELALATPAQLSSAG
jgi:glycosyltransferase involved in cell wall biosynthesis